MSFGIANNIRSEVRECTPELLNQALDSALVARTCSEIEDALEKFRRGELSQDEYETIKATLKKRLPIITFHATFRNGRRKNNEAIPSGLSIYDLDHIENPRERWAEIEARKEELGILLAHISPSLEGLRLVFIMPQGMDLAQAQAWMAQQLGDTQYDSCVKDYARCSFVVPRDYVLHLDESGLFLPRHIVIQSEAKNLEDTMQVKTQVDAPEILPPFGRLDDNNEGVNNKKSYPQTYDDILYEQIVETLEEQMGGTPEHGSRNNFIFSMACHLRYICNDDPEWIAQVLPTYGEAQEKWMASIRSACARNQTKTMPRIIRRTLAICKERMEDNSELITHNSELNAPPMPTVLPPLIKLLVSKTPKIYRPAVAHAVFPALGAHLWKTYFKYIDNVEHEATLMNVLMAGTGAGKNCIAEPVNRILKDIRKRDAENLERENEWKKEVNSKGANKDKRQRPEGLVMQEMDPDTTNAAFVQRLADAEERFLYARMNEIEQFEALKTNSNKYAYFQIMCLAFDPGNVYGQTRVGTSSVSARVCIRFNWNASTTIRKGKAFFRRVLTDGPISRINFCTIPEQPIGADMPIYGTYDSAFDEELRPYIERLNKARGLVECRSVSILAKKMMKENAEFARLSQSRVYENLSFRANVIAFLKAMVLFVAQGGVWDKVSENFIRWSLKYDMWCKMHFFGEEIEELENSIAKSNKPGPQNLLDLLPDVFTREEAQALRKRQGITRGTLSAMLYNWKSRGHIECLDDEACPKYAKTKSYLRSRSSYASPY